ncbi:MAG: DUF481 domain-containing protein [bacterium]|nr:DUF481 domain-containing protein [bacterium]
MKYYFILLFSLVTLLFFVCADLSAADTAWKNNMEFSLLTTSGNTRTQSLGLKTETIKENPKFKFILNTGYFNAKTSGEETANNWLVKIKEEFSISGKLYLYDILGTESDKYAGFNYRYNAQGGLGYSLIKTSKDELKTELGIDFKSEKRIDVESKDFTSGRYFLGYLHNFTEMTLLNTSADYLYDFSDSENWRSNGELSISAKLKENLSLNTGVSYKFANLPVTGKSKTDVLTATALMLSF